MPPRKIKKEFALLTDVPAGFPSPAADDIQKNLDLNELLISHPAATFFVKVLGYSMKDAGIFSGDILVVDRAVDPYDKAIVVVVIDGNFTVKRYTRRGIKTFLVPANDSFKEIEVTENTEMEIWGVVTHVIHKATK